jgi:hypothetical protein
MDISNSAQRVAVPSVKTASLWRLQQQNHYNCITTSSHVPELCCGYGQLTASPNMRVRVAAADAVYVRSVLWRTVRPLPVSGRLMPCALPIRGHPVAQLVEALRYKPEGRGFVPDGVTGIFH